MITLFPTPANERQRRQQEGVLARARTLFASGQRLQTADENRYQVINANGEVQVVDTQTKTCTCPAHCRFLEQRQPCYLQPCLEIPGNPHPPCEPGEKYRLQHESASRTRAKEVHAKLPGIAKDFGRILDGAVWHYCPDHEVREGDFLVDHRLVQALRSGGAPDFDAYDAATWSVIAPLSEKSVADRTCPVDFLDFTKGKWKTTPPFQLMGV